MEEKKIRTLEDLKKLKSEVLSGVKLREKGENTDNLVQIKVSMATCGIASGAKDTFTYLIRRLDEESIDAVVTQTGCMGYCHAEPTVDVKLPGEEPLVYGHVKEEKAEEIIQKYIKAGKIVDGVIPQSYKTIENEEK